MNNYVVLQFVTMVSIAMERFSLDISTVLSIKLQENREDEKRTKFQRLSASSF